MNCARCGYLLWKLPEDRCPECARPFEATDYAFAPGSVQFVCRGCGQSYLGSDDRGLPSPQRFECAKCGQSLDAAHLSVHPLREDAHGEMLRLGTPWENRRRVGRVRAFLDGVARLAIQPGEFFRLSAASRDQGAMAFSVLCAYAAVAMFAVVVMLLQNAGLVAWLPAPGKFMRPAFLMGVIMIVPFAQIAWNYLYGGLIQAVLRGMGQRDLELESSVKAVAFGSAVLPAVLLLPPVGLLWYISVVTSGIEQLHDTTKLRALTATLLPMLLAANLALLLVFTLF